VVAFPTHTEPVNLYVAVVADPGERKSSVLSHMAFPLEEAEREMRREATPAVCQAEEDRHIKLKQQAHLRDIAAKAKAETERKAAEDSLAGIAEALAEKPQTLPRLLADDVTPEQLATLMSENGDALAVFSAEGGLFGILAGRYTGDKVNLDLFLKAHAADPVRVDRKGRPSEHLARPALTLGLAIQPDVLTSLADTPAFRGRGLLGRFLYSLPTSLVGTRLYDATRTLDQPARHCYSWVLRSLLAIPSPATEEDPTARHSLTLSSEALEAWRQEYDAVERRLDVGGDLHGIRDWAGKLAGAVARIAGGMHLVEKAGDDAPWKTPISKKSILAAWAIGDYLIAHALAAYGQIGADANMALALRLLRWVERQETETFTLRDCHRAHRFVNAPGDLLPPLVLLCERGYLRAEEAEHTGPGRKPSPVFRIHPDHRHDAA
jgi:hypothetical protein